MEELEVLKEILSTVSATGIGAFYAWLGYKLIVTAAYYSLWVMAGVGGVKLVKHCISEVMLESERSLQQSRFDHDRIVQERKLFREKIDTVG